MAVNLADMADLPSGIHTDLQLGRRFQGQGVITVVQPQKMISLVIGMGILSLHLPENGLHAPLSVIGDALSRGFVHDKMLHLQPQLLETVHLAAPLKMADEAGEIFLIIIHIL